MEQQDKQNKKPRIALCTDEVGGGQWRMLFLDTLEVCRVPHFLGAKRGKWFEQSEEGKWQQVEPKELAEFEVRLDELDEWCCLKIRLPIYFESDTFISSINPRISGNVHVEIGDRKRQTVHYWAYVSLTSALFTEEWGSTNLQWSIRSEADILGPLEQLDRHQQQEVVEEEAVEDLRKFSPEEMKIVPYQPHLIGLGQEEQAEQQHMVENAEANEQQNIDRIDGQHQPKKTKTPKELEKTQQEALVLCWKQSSEDSFLCEWNPTTKQFMFNRRFQANNKRLNDANVSIQLGGWYQLCFVKYKKSSQHISILECEEVLDAPFDKHIQDRIIQFFPNVTAVNSILKKMSKENQQQRFPGTVQQRPLSQAESIQSVQQEDQGLIKRRPEDDSVSEPPEDDEGVHHVPRPLNTVQSFTLSAPDSTRKLSMASSRASTSTRTSNQNQKEAPNTYRQALDVPKKYRGVLVGRDGNMLAKLESKYGVKLSVPSEFSNKQVEITGTVDNVNRCKQAIEAMIRRLQTKKIILPVPNWSLIPLLIGKNGNNIKQLRATFREVKVDVPRPSELKKTGDECLPIITLQGDADEVDSLRELLVQQIKELEERHFILCIPIPTDHPVHDVSSFLKYLRGKGSKRIRQLEERFPEVKLDLPISTDNSPKIRLEGPEEKVYELKTTIEAVFEELRKIRVDKIVHDHVPVEEKYFSRFLRNKGQVIEEIREEHPNCRINLDRKRKRFHLQGKRADVDAAKRRIEEILDEMNEITRKVSIPCNAQHSCTKHLEVPREYRQQLMDKSAEKLHKIQQKFNVYIDAQKPQEGQRSVQLTVIGAEQMVERCVKFMREDMPTSKLVKVPHEFRDHFLGNGRQLVQQLQKQHGVQIHFAPRVDCSDDVAVVGEAAHVDACIRAILQKVTQFREEKNSAPPRATTSNVRLPQLQASSLFVALLHQ